MISEAFSVLCKLSSNIFGVFVIELLRMHIICFHHLM